MQSSAIRNRHAMNSRRGLSFVEFVGCLAALGGGVALGSIYLGIDVKAAAIEILERADIEVPKILINNGRADEESLTAETPRRDIAVTGEAAAGNPGGNGTSSDQQAAQPERATTSDDATQIALSVRAKLTDAEQRAATHACWLALDQSVQEEAANRSKSIDDPKNWHLFDYLLRRKEGHQQAADAIELLDLYGAEQRVRLHAQQLLAWHQAGAALYDRATQLITDPPTGKLSGPFAQSWQSAATQHRMEEKLILDKHAAVASYLDHAAKQSKRADR